MTQEPPKTKLPLKMNRSVFIVLIMACFALLLVLMADMFKGQWPPDRLWLGLALGLGFILRRMGGIERSENEPKSRRVIRLGILTIALINLIIGLVGLIGSLRY